MAKSNNKSDNPSILSKNFQAQGDIRSSGILEIEGKIKGTIKGIEVIIRESGVVDGLIEAESLTIQGFFNGDIKANSINIFQKAKVTGNIEYNSISVEDGACVDGQFKKLDSASTSNKVANENATNIKLKSV